MSSPIKRKATTYCALFAVVTILVTSCGPAVIVTDEPIPTPYPLETKTETPTPAPPTATATPKPEEYFHLGWSWSDSESPLSGDLAIGSNGTIYVTDESGTLYAIASPGKLLWTFKKDYDSATAPVVGNDGTVYIIGTKGNPGLQFPIPLLIEEEETTAQQTIYAISPDGTMKWTFVPDLELHLSKTFIELSSPMLVSPDGSIYVNTWDPDFPDSTSYYHIRPDGDANLIKGPIDLRFFISAFDSQNRLVIWSWENKKIYTITPDGEIISKCEEEKYIRTWLIEKDGTLIYRRDDGNGTEIEIVARKPDCSVQWIYRTGVGMDGMGDDPLASDHNGTIYFSANDGDDYVIDARDGTLLWKTNLTQSEEDIKGFAVGQEQVFFLGEFASLGAFDSDGNRLWYHPLYDPGKPGPFLLGPSNELIVIHNGKILAYTADKSVAEEEPAPAPLPSDREAAENEIALAMLDHYVENKIRPLDNPPSIVIWYPEHKGIPLDEVVPIKAWLILAGNVTEAIEPKKAVEDFRKQYVNDSSSMYMYGLYEFTIRLVSDDFKTATVYKNQHHAGCFLIGIGESHLVRSPSGKWWIYGY